MGETNNEFETLILAVYIESKQWSLNQSRFIKKKQFALEANGWTEVYCTLHYSDYRIVGWF